MHLTQHATTIMAVPPHDPRRTRNVHRSLRKPRKLSERCIHETTTSTLNTTNTQKAS